MRWGRHGRRYRSAEDLGNTKLVLFHMSLASDLMVGSWIHELYDL